MLCRHNLVGIPYLRARPRRACRIRRNYDLVPDRQHICRNFIEKSILHRCRKCRRGEPHLSRPAFPRLERVLMRLPTHVHQPHVPKIDASGLKDLMIYPPHDLYPTTFYGYDPEAWNVTARKHLHQGLYESSIASCLFIHTLIILKSQLGRVL